METKNCLTCGIIIYKTPKSNWGKRKYCSSNCSQKHLRKLNPERYREEDMKRYNTEERKLNRQTQKERKKILRKGKLQIKMCFGCKQEFKETQINQKYCSRKCWNHIWYLNQRKLKEHPIISCLTCGKETIKFNINQKFCSKVCGNKYDYLSKKEHYNQLTKLNHIKNKDILRERKKEYYESIKEEENKRREKLGLPLIGEGFKKEMELFVYLSSLFPNETIIKHDRKTLGGLELDFYLPDLNLAFEYMGRQHFEINYIKKRTIYIQTKEQFEAQKFRDNKKIGLCKEKGITLIHFNYDECLSEQDVIKKLNENNIQTVQENL